jgi:hypothetical protein
MNEKKLKIYPTIHTGNGHSNTPGLFCFADVSAINRTRPCPGNTLACAFTSSGF